MDSRPYTRKQFLNNILQALLAGLIFGFLFGLLTGRYADTFLHAMTIALSITLLNSLIHRFILPLIPVEPRRVRLIKEIGLFFVSSLLGYLIPILVFYFVFDFDYYRPGLILMNMGLLVILYGMISGMGYSLQFYKELRKKEQEELELRTLFAQSRLRGLKAQMQPHFLFNTLNTIHALIPRDPGKARKLIGHLSDLLRMTLETRERTLIPLREEIAFVRGYMAIVRARFGNRVLYEESVDPGLDEMLIPGMVLQPLLENAVIHGVATTRQKVWIRMFLRLQGDEIVCEITNSLPSGNYSGNGTAISLGTGLSNLDQRLRLIYGGRTKLIYGRQNSQCFQVILTIPGMKNEADKSFDRG
jgi:sensor histidine kinase YesM